MDKLIYSTSCSLLTSSFLIVFLIAIGVKIRNLPIPFVLTSDVVLFMFYKNEIINNSESYELFYIYLYYAVSFIFSICYISYIFIRKSSSRCICNRCRDPTYEEIKDNNTF